LVFVVPVTVAVNTFWEPTLTLEFSGETDKTIGLMMMVAVPDFVESAADVAARVTVVSPETAEGAA
jgi:hypothetical protein